MSKVVARLVYDSSSAQSVASGDAISFASSTLSSEVTYESSGIIQIKKAGTYLIHANFDAIATEAGSIGINLVEGLVEVPGASATETASAADDYISLSFSAASTVRPASSLSYASLYFAPTADTSISLANVIIEKVS